MKEYNICVEVVRTFTCKANSKEEALEKYMEGEDGVWDEGEVSEPLKILVKPIVYDENWEEVNE